MLLFILIILMCFIRKLFHFEFTADLNLDAFQNAKLSESEIQPSTNGAPVLCLGVQNGYKSPSDCLHKGHVLFILLILSTDNRFFLYFLIIFKNIFSSIFQ